MIHFIIATHGPLASALLESGKMVYGELPHVKTICLTEESGIEGFRHDFYDVLKTASLEASGVVVLCDMQSGTPWNVACEHAFKPQNYSTIAVVAGVNFPMLLQTEEVMTCADAHTAAAHLIELTRAALTQAIPVTSAQTDDF